MNENSNLAYLLTYVNYWPINFNSSQILTYFPLSPIILGEKEENRPKFEMN